MRIDRIMIRGIRDGRYTADVLVNMDLLGSQVITFVIDQSDDGYMIKDKMGNRLFSNMFQSLDSCHLAILLLLEIDPTQSKRN